MSTFLKFPRWILKQKVRSSTIFVSFFIVITHNSTVNFKLISYFGEKDPIKVPILTLSRALVKNCQIPHVIFQAASQFFCKFCITLQCDERKLLCNFLAQTTYTFLERSPLKWNSLILSSAKVKICQIFYVNSETASRFPSNVCIPLQFHKR